MGRPDAAESSLIRCCGSGTCVRGLPVEIRFLRRCTGPIIAGLLGIFGTAIDVTAVDGRCRDLFSDLHNEPVFGAVQSWSPRA
jgi:hypothetical protein